MLCHTNQRGSIKASKLGLARKYLLIFLFLWSQWLTPGLEWWATVILKLGCTLESPGDSDLIGLKHLNKGCLKGPQVFCFFFKGGGQVSLMCRQVWENCMRAKLRQSCLTLCNHMDCSLPGFSVYGILQARIVEWVTTPFPRGSSWLRDLTCNSYVNLH